MGVSPRESRILERECRMLIHPPTDHVHLPTDLPF